MSRAAVALAVMVLPHEALADEPASDDYRTTVVVNDSIAVASTATIIASMWAIDQQHWLQAPAVALSMQPTMLIGSTTHAIHGNPIAAGISFAGWTLNGMIGWTLNHALTTVRPTCDAPPCRLQNPTSLVVPLVLSEIGAGVMMVTDALLAKGRTRDERGDYRIDVLSADLIALSSIAISIATGYFAGFHDVTGTLVVIPSVILVAPSVHWANGHRATAFTSILGWTTTVTTTFAVFAFTKAFSEGFSGVPAPGFVAGLTLLNGVLGSIGMTIHDVFLARSRERSSVALMPTGWLTDTSAGFGVGGAF